MTASSAEGRAGRDAGIKRAVDHAEQVTPKWADRAFDVLIDFMTIGRIATGGKFTAEDVRDHAGRLNLPPPPHLRAWGGVFLRAARRGLIVKAGTTEAKAAHVHRAIISVWRLSGVRHG